MYTKRKCQRVIVFQYTVIQYNRACFSYVCFILNETRLSNKLFELGFVKKSLELELKKLYGQYGHRIEQYNFFLPQNSTWHSEAWLYTMTPSTNLTFHPKMTCHLPNCASFPWDICNRCSMLTDYALSSDNKSRSILGLYCLYFLRPILFPSLSWLSEHCHFNIQRHFKTKYIQNFNYCMQWYWSK